MNKELEKAAFDYINSEAVKAENMQLAFGDFINGAEWMQKKMIDKACEILKNVTVTYNRRFFGKCEENAFDVDFINEFRKAMEE